MANAACVVRRTLVAVCALALHAGGTAHAAASVEELTQLVQRLNERLDRVEKRNAELERQLQNAPSVSAVEQRVKTLENNDARIKSALENENISEKEPELTSRLKAVEYQTLGMLKQARTVEALDGINAGVSFTTVAQKPYDAPPSSDATNSQLNYRGDVYVSLPLANIGDTESRIFAQFRLGQGSGLNGMNTYSKPNATAFRVLSAQPDDSVAVLGQAWYQATLPLPLGGFKPRSREKLELNFGKMDPFVFFDQNAAANDETRQFLNTVFVHNPLLDAGGDIGVDANGFAPGLRVSYLSEQHKPQTWRASLGVFGAGRGANYTRTFGSPLIIGQAETQLKLFEGLTGNYRAYYWRNGQVTPYTGEPEPHAGWGVSADQRLGDGITLFGRIGAQTRGRARFDRALTFGGEFAGSYWDRGGDVVGLAFGWLETSSEFRRDSATVDANGDGIPDFGYAASGSERVAELYYRYRINKQFELSPDFQLIVKPAGNGNAKTVKLVGMRAQITY